MWVAVVVLCMAKADATQGCVSRTIPAWWPSEQTCRAAADAAQIGILAAPRPDGSAILWIGGECFNVRTRET